MKKQWTIKYSSQHKTICQLWQLSSTDESEQITLFSWEGRYGGTCHHKQASEISKCSTCEVEARGSRVQGQPCLHIQFKISLTTWSSVSNKLSSQTNVFFPRRCPQQDMQLDVLENQQWVKTKFQHTDTYFYEFMLLSLNFPHRLREGPMQNNGAHDYSNGHCK